MRRTEVLSNFDAENKYLLTKKRTTFEQVYNNFLTEKKAENCSEYTLRYYDRNIWKIISKYNLVYIDQLTKEKINEIVVAEKEEKPEKAIRTINTTLMAIRTFVYYCQSKGLIPVYKIKLLKMQEEPKETYTDDELKKLIRKPDTRRWVEWRDWAVINYLIGTGNRASSILNIKIKDIDFGNKCLALTHTKNKRSQIVPLTESLIDVLQIYLRTFEWTDDDYLFPTNEGKQWQLRSFQDEIAKYNHERGVDKTSIHLFRHTFAKNYLLAGGTIGQLQRLLGHSSPQMSLHYAQIYGLEELSINYEKTNPLARIASKNSNI